MSRFILTLAACLVAVPAFAVTVQKPDTQASTGDDEITAADINAYFLSNCPAAQAYYTNKSDTDYIAGQLDTLTGTAQRLQAQVNGPPSMHIEFANPALAASIPPSFTGTYWLAIEPLDIAAIYVGTGASCKLLMAPSLYTELPAP